MLLAAFDEAPSGNVVGKDGNTYAYPAPTAALPNAVSSISGTVNGVANPSYQYDYRGRLLRECPSGNCTTPSRTLSWTADGYPTGMTRGSTGLTFWYDADRARMAQLATVGGANTLSFYGPAGYERVETAAGAEQKVYLRVEGRLVGIVSATADGPQYRYVMTDHLGSPSALLSEQGTVLEREGFDAWGRRRNVDGTDNAAATSVERRGYTSHEHLDSVGLIHMNGRVYDPALARFVSPDPYVARRVSSSAA